MKTNKQNMNNSNLLLSDAGVITRLEGLLNYIQGIQQQQKALREAKKNLASHCHLPNWRKQKDKYTTQYGILLE